MAKERSQCIRLKRQCRYPDPEPQDGVHRDLNIPDKPWHVDFQQVAASLGSQKPTHDGRLGGLDENETMESSVKFNTDFPVTFFLESESFRPIPRDQESQARRWHPPSRSLDSDQVDTETKGRMGFVNRFAAVIHPWLPILSLKRLRQDIMVLHPGHPEVRLLLLCMSLLLDKTSKSGDTRHSEYVTASRKCFEAESRGFISLRLLQCLVFLATYELGQAIYPAAYLTIGRAARVGSLIGLHDCRDAPQLFTPADTWTLGEEQRRTWWAILILDRVAVVGSPGLRLSTPEPSSDDLLPSADESWTQGRVDMNEALLSQHFHSASLLGPFARTCQAAHMLGKVIQHGICRKTATNTAALLEEALALQKILAALASSMVVESKSESKIKHQPTGPPTTAATSMTAALAITCTAQYLLYSHYACNEYAQASLERTRVALEVELQKICLRAIRETSWLHSAAIAVAVIDDQKGDAIYHSPVIPACLYHAATECAWFYKEGEDAQSMLKALELLICGLRIMSGRWQVAHEYLGILQANGTLALLE